MHTHSKIRTALVGAVAAISLVITAGCSSTGQAAGVSDSITQAADTVATASSGDTATAPQPADQRRTITVTGVGTVSGTPDTVTVQLGVQTRASTASKALKENNSAANAVIDRLRKAGVAKKDLQTTQLSIHATRSSNGSSITGYEVSNFVTATLHDTSKAGDIIDAAQKAAGDAIRVNNIRFSFADDSSLRTSAREHAVKQAMAQAKQLATAAGLTVGPVLSITEGAPGGNPTPMTLSAAAAPAGGESMPTLPGSQDLTVQVQVVVAIG